MKISEHTISALGSVITGDNCIAPYRTGPELVNFFNQFGRSDSYGEGFPSRWAYAEDCIRSLNETDQMKKVIVAAIDPRHFIGTDKSPEKLVEHLSQFLEFDGLQLVSRGKTWEVSTISDSVDLSHPYENSTAITHVFISEQVQKCAQKLSYGDYDGAITNSRSLLEAVLTSIEQDLDPSPPKYDGNLPKLYKRVQRLLNLSPGQEGLADSLRQILSGMTSIVNGLASLRNTMSDSHVVSYRPAKHHAQLAVNCAKTLSGFLFETKTFQE